MLFKRDILDGIAAGKITLAFRRWKRPTVKPGGMLRTPIGVLRILSVDSIDEGAVTDREARRAGFASRHDVFKDQSRRDGDLLRIKFERAGNDPRIALRKQARLRADDVAELQVRLGRLDARSTNGRWTARILQLIADHPEQRAADLAAIGRYEKEWLKTNIRKLKNLGLTESLRVGYRLSPRGAAYLESLNES